jgi:hypothetical protein
MPLPTFIRMKELKERGIVRNWPQLKDLQERAGFPLGRLLGDSNSHSRVWTEDEIADWLESRPVDPAPVRGAIKRRIEAKKARTVGEVTA